MPCMRAKVMKKPEEGKGKEYASIKVEATFHSSRIATDIFEVR